MSVGVIGKKMYWKVGARVLPFLVIDPNCPTVRDRRNIPNIFGETLFEYIPRMGLEKVLLTPTDPVKVVLVRETYPTFEAKFYEMSREQFNYFKFLIRGHQPAVEKRFYWLTEGF